MEVLLAGCGDTGGRPHLQRLGFQTLAFDIKRTRGTDFLADAHCLPIQDDSFDLVLSMQVLEHLHSPWIGVREVARVLRPGGWFIGSVAFLKPYHGGSYYHMTHKGVMHLLGSYGLEVDRIEGAQSVTYALYGMRIPLRTRSIKRLVYGGFDALVDSLRARFWSLRTKMDPDRATDRFATEGLSMSFKTFDKLRAAPAVVVRAHKVNS